METSVNLKKSTRILHHPLLAIYGGKVAEGFVCVCVCVLGGGGGELERKREGYS